MKMRVWAAFTVAWAVVLCTGAIFAADGLTITFTSNGAVVGGEAYDDVFVHGDATVVGIRGGVVGNLWARNKSTVNITGGRVTYAQSHEQSTINISGGIVTEPSIVNIGGAINVSGGTCWNIDVGPGKLNLSGGQIVGLGVSAPEPGGTIHVHGRDFKYYPFPGRNDGRLKGFWHDGTPFSIDFLRGAFEAVVLHEIPDNLTPIANAGEDQSVLAAVGTMAAVVLDGSASSDPELDELAYEWTWTIDKQTYSATGAKPTIMLPVGVHPIKLIVSDSAAHSGTDEVVITVQTLTQQIHTVRTGKLKLLQELDAMSRKEEQVAAMLTIMLASGNYGDLARSNILDAREAIYSAMEHHEQSRRSLQKSIEKLEDTLLLLDSPVDTENL